MILKIEINIPEKECKEGIAAGWNERFDEELDPDDITITDNIADFVSAVPYLILNEDNTTITIHKGI